MTKEENIDYLTLRAEECRLPDEEVRKVREALKAVDENGYDRLKRVSEPEFRAWCRKACGQS